MSKRRRQGKEKEVLVVLIGQGAVIPCFRCKEPITEEDVRTGNVEKEHLHEVELGGADDPSNWRFSHKRKPCHALVTHGNGATFAGSSRHRIAKATDPKRIEKFQVVKPGPLPPALKLPDLIAAGDKCRRCGEYSTECECPMPFLAHFGRTRASRAISSVSAPPHARAAMAAGATIRKREITP